MSSYPRKSVVGQFNEHSHRGDTAETQNRTATGETQRKHRTALPQGKHSGNTEPLRFLVLRTVARFRATRDRSLAARSAA